ncbi:hypothetical protein D9619_006526 [Psilocybe cf. subviscida]|uniref:Flavin reductase like domain-containing protein n=1 Tax=Psilocybe cf. subviscida TaxID=2480587 RepID=A0A8H5EYK3_9AGAR|nr:hypothetical protein D9619_006526 [Psilocybe cf. subviscida]
MKLTKTESEPDDDGSKNDSASAQIFGASTQFAPARSTVKLQSAFVLRPPMSPTTATFARECRSFCKTLTVDPSRCIYTAKKPLPFNHSIPTTSQHRRHANSMRLLHTARATGSGRETQEGTQRKLKDDLRALLRDVAQPVAIVTSFMPSGNDAPFISKVPGALANEARAGESTSQVEGSRYHGATLSSFTSIAMDPYPLIAFALRIPSRMATSLSSLVAPSASSRTRTPSSTTPPTSPPLSHPSHMVINLLSASQASEAVTFSRPDLHPTPFYSPTNPNGVKYTQSPDGLPVLRGVVGALSCKLVGPPIPLHDLDYFTDGGMGRGEQARRESEPGLELEEGAVTSELFIAQVVRVEDVASVSDVEHTTTDGERTLPLVYHRQRYTSCRPNPKHDGKQS